MCRGRGSPGSHHGHPDAVDEPSTCSSNEFLGPRGSLKGPPAFPPPPARNSSIILNLHRLPAMIWDFLRFRQTSVKISKKKNKLDDSDENSANFAKKCFFLNNYIFHHNLERCPLKYVRMDHTDHFDFR